MMNKIPFIVSIFSLAILIACNVTKLDNEGVIEEKGIIIEKIKFTDEKSSGEIIKNKLTKTASLKLIFSLNNSDEYVDFFDGQTAITPSLVNFFCDLFSVALFNRSALADPKEYGFFIENDSENPLKGYKGKSLYIEFIDYEDNTKIADCASTGPSWENIKFNAYKHYNFSFVEIGKLPKDDSP